MELQELPSVMMVLRIQFYIYKMIWASDKRNNYQYL